MESKSDKEETQRKIWEILKETTASWEDWEAVGLDDDLFDLGILDSIAMVMVAVKLERTFSLQVPTGDFEPVNFSTARAIALLIERRRLDPGRLPS